MDLFYQLMELFATFTEGFIILTVAFRLSAKKRRKSETVFLLLITTALYTALITVMNKWKVFSFLTILLAVVYMVLITKWISKENFLVCCTVIILSCFVLNAIDYFLIYFLLIVSGHLLDVTKGFEYMMMAGWNRVLFLVSDKLLQAFFMIGFGKHFIKLKSIDRGNVKLILFFSTVAYGLLNFLTSVIVTDSLLKIQIAVILSYLFIVVALAAMIVVISISTKYQNEKRAKELIYYTNTMTENNFRQFEQSQKKIQQQVHDFKNHLIAIDGLIEKDMKAKAYIEDLLSIAFSNANHCHSGSKIIDAIINSKLESAKTQNIAFEYHTRLTGELHIASIDICAVLSNQIDNAIEASVKIPVADERWIRIDIWQKEYFVFFKVANAVATNPFDEKHQLPSSKNNSTELHGLGIKNISETAFKYGGTLKNDCADNIFTSVAMLLNNE